MTDRPYLDPLLEPRLWVVFVGTEPGPTSLKTGNYYANPDNSFFDDLFEAQLTDRQLLPGQYRELLDFGIGLDDVYLDLRGLRNRIRKVAPVAVCFNSKGALQRLSDEEIGQRAWMGENANEWAVLEGAQTVWALPDSSPRARRFRPQRIQLLRQLKTYVGRGGTE